MQTQPNVLLCDPILHNICKYSDADTLKNLQLTCYPIYRFISRRRYFYSTKPVLKVALYQDLVEVDTLTHQYSIKIMNTDHLSRYIYSLNPQIAIIDTDDIFAKIRDSWYHSLRTIYLTITEGTSIDVWIPKFSGCNDLRIKSTSKVRADDILQVMPYVTSFSFHKTREDGGLIANDQTLALVTEKVKRGPGLFHLYLDCEDQSSFSPEAVVKFLTGTKLARSDFGFTRVTLHIDRINGYRSRLYDLLYPIHQIVCFADHMAYMIIRMDTGTEVVLTVDEFLKSTPRII